MTELDKAVDELRSNPENSDSQSSFYNLLLNTTFFVPSVKETLSSTGKGGEEEIELPMIVPSEGEEYLVLFDMEERLHAWAGKRVPFLSISGHAIADFSPESFCWALNPGGTYSRQLIPEEIAWLKRVVRAYNAAKEGKGGKDSPCSRKGKE